MTTAKKGIYLTERDLGRLRAQCRGAVHGLSSPGYADVCVGYNPFVVWSPEVVVSASDAADVAEAVKFAREQGLTVAVRSGGTGWAGAPAGSLLLDLRALRRAEVGADTARVQAGAIWADIDAQTAPYGRFAPGSQTSWVGVGGYALGGGWSWLGRRHGWCSDNVTSVELVNDAGRSIRVDAETEPDLFWGLRGSGWNFGVVTALTMRTFPYRTVLAGDLVWSIDTLGDLLRFWSSWTVHAPDELTSDLAIVRPPGGAPAVARIAFCLAESSPIGLAAVEALRGFGAPVMDTTADTDYLTLQGAATEFLRPGMSQRFRMRYLDAVDESIVSTTVAAVDQLPPLSLISLHHYGGAAARDPAVPSAFSHRDARFNYMVNIRWPPTEDAMQRLAWQDALLQQVAAADAAEDRAYVNYLFDEPSRIHSAYTEPALTRLRKIKSTWDPSNLFCHNVNVAPQSPRP